MEILNRKADVDNLRCKVCQDFLKLVIESSWQEPLIKLCEKIIECEEPYKDSYSGAYDKMRERGAEYSIDDMDISFIYTIVKFCSGKDKGIIQNPVSDPTINAFRFVKEDRNETQGHTSFNEDQEELYLNCLLSLCKLKSFVKTVDRYDLWINKDLRLKFRKKNTDEIDKLRELIDEERIENIYKYKAIDNDIQEVKHEFKTISERGLSNASYHKFEIFDKKLRYYFDKTKTEDGYKLYGEFVVKASDEGISEADSYAAHYLLNDEDRYEEGLHRCLKLYNEGEKIDNLWSYELVSVIKKHIKNNKPITDDMKQIIELLQEYGLDIE